MKKILLLVSIVLAFAACNTAGNSPKATVDAMFTAMKNGNLDEMKKCITKSDVSMIEAGEKFLTALDPDAVKKMREKMTTEFKDKVKDVKYTLKDEKIDGDKATVTAEVVENGKTESHNFDLVKEDGAWKVSFMKSGFTGEDKAKMEEAMKNMNTDSLMNKMKEGLKNVNVDSLMNAAKESMKNLNGPKGDSLEKIMKEAQEQMKKMQH